MMISRSLRSLGLGVLCGALSVSCLRAEQVKPTRQVDLLVAITPEEAINQILALSEKITASDVVAVESRLVAEEIKIARELQTLIDAFLSEQKSGNGRLGVKEGVDIPGHFIARWLPDPWSSYPDSYEGRYDNLVHNLVKLNYKIDGLDTLLIIADFCESPGIFTDDKETENAKDNLQEDIYEGIDECAERLAQIPFLDAYTEREKFNQLCLDVITYDEILKELSATKCGEEVMKSKKRFEEHQAAVQARLRHFEQPVMAETKPASTEACA